MSEATAPSVPLAKTAAIILAAGHGTRMKSALPKVLHPVAGRPLVHYPVRAALEAGCGEVVVVVGHGRGGVEEYLHRTFGDRVKIAVQASQRGTGDAALAGLSAVSKIAFVGPGKAATPTISPTAAVSRCFAVRTASSIRARMLPFCSASSPWTRPKPESLIPPNGVSHAA